MGAQLKTVVEKILRLALPTAPALESARA
jgi:hypothetical protein